MKERSYVNSALQFTESSIIVSEIDHYLLVTGPQFYIWLKKEPKLNNAVVFQH